MRAGSEACEVTPMGSISLVEGKKQLLKIQVPCLVGLQQAFHWGTVLRRVLTVKPSLLLAVMSVVLLLYLLRQSYLKYADSQLENTLILSDSCEDCRVKPPLHISQLSPHLLLVLIHASATAIARRDAIRNTWMSEFKNLQHTPVQYRFVLGGAMLRSDTMDQLLKEAEEHKDIIVLPNVTDSLQTLTKRAIKSFKFALEQFEFSYVLKCDDDTFVDVLRLASELQLRRDRTRLYWGFMVGRNGVIRYMPGPYRETEWSVCDLYMPYAVGGGYLLSRDLIQLLVQNEAHFKLYKCEDVSVGAWLAPYNIERRHDTRFDTESKTRGCKSVFLISHKVSPSEMYTYYRSLQVEGLHCSWRTRSFYWNGYMYNWSASPSHCCSRQTGIP